MMQESHQTQLNTCAVLQRELNRYVEKTEQKGMEVILFQKLQKVCQDLTKDLVPHLNHHVSTIAQKDKDTQMKFISSLNTRVLSVVYALIRIYHEKRVQTQTYTQELTEQQLSELGVSLSGILEEIKTCCNLMQNFLRKDLSIACSFLDHALKNGSQLKSQRYTIQLQTQEARPVQLQQPLQDVVVTSIKTLEPLQNSIESIYSQCLASTADIEFANVTIQRLKCSLGFMKELVDPWELQPFGKFANRLLQRNNSKLTLTLVSLQQEELNHDTLLRKIEWHLLKRFNNVYSKIELRYTTRDIRLTFTDRETKMRVELTVNNVVQIYRSQQLATYSQLDNRFHKLCCYLNYLLKLHFPIKAQRLSSYALSLLVLYFLQSLQKPLLPNIQVYGANSIKYQVQFKRTFIIKLYRETNVQMLSVEEAKQKMQQWTHLNLMSEAELLYEFLAFMKNFPKDKVIYSSLGRLLEKEKLNSSKYDRHTDKDNNPWLHPYFIVDAIDMFDNPAKRVKSDSELEKQYDRFFAKSLQRIDDGEPLVQSQEHPQTTVQFEISQALNERHLRSEPFTDITILESNQ